ncbi:MAG: 30S ribosomal protein S20 [Clostridia bacterium]|nr:30S ribosomal protein S20 [Clostridia bacterium]
MPNIKSAIKRVSVTERKTLRNKMVKSATKTAMKKFNTNMTAEALVAASAAVDKAAAKGVISKNAANRQKARMARALNKA